MSIVRTLHNKENPYAQINKKALWDQNLSLEAVGLWTRLLSRPDDWKVSVTELCKSCDCSTKKIYRILNELVTHGYAYRFQGKNTEGGTFTPYETVVFETKRSPSQIQKMFPLSQKRLSGDPLSGNRHTTNTYSTKTDKNPPLSSPQKIKPKKESLRSEEEEIRIYEELKNCPMSDKQMQRVSKDYSEEQVTKAIAITKKQKIKKSFTGLLLNILKNPEEWPEMSSEPQITHEQKMALNYNLELKKIDPSLFKENEKLLRENKIKIITDTGIEQTSLTSFYAQGDLKKAQRYLKEKQW